jgi:hypothetical protein
VFDAWREVGSPHSSEEAGESRWSKGGDEFRSMRSRQLTFVFADSPQGGKEVRPLDESAGKTHLPHRAKGMPTTSLIAPAASAAAWPRVLNPEIPTRRAGCVVHKSGSVRGPGEQSPGPTRLEQAGFFAGGWRGAGSSGGAAALRRRRQGWLAAGF